MLTSQRLELKRSERRERMTALAELDTLDDEQRSELDTLLAESKDHEKQYRAALEAEAAAADAAEAEGGATGSEKANSEDADRLELRARCSVGRFLLGNLPNRRLDGAEAELASELGLESGRIPLELWEPEKRAAEPEKRAVTDAPSTVGVNLDLVRPAVFAQSVVPSLGVEMPRVPSGTYASPTISTSVTAASRAKSADAPATAAAFTVTTAVPKRIAARLELTLEDISAVGQENFEAALRENLAMAMSDQLDTQGLNGNGTAPNLQGIIGRLTDPTDPTAVADWAAFAGLAADHVDGLWAMTEGDVELLVNVDAYKLACKTFRVPGIRGTGGGTNADLDTPGDKSAAEYLAGRAGRFRTNARMPATASDIAIGIARRTGRAGMRTAVCPVWSDIVIDDMYSGSGKGERYVSFHILCGDVIVVQPGAYSRFDLKVA